MTNKNKFSFILCYLIADLLAIAGGTVLFLNFANETNVVWNKFTIDTIFIASLVTWIFSGLYFGLYKLDATFRLNTFYRNTWYALFLYCVVWQSYLLVFQKTTQFNIAISANIFQLSFLLFYFFASRLLFTIVLIKLEKQIKSTFNVAIWGFNKTSIALASQFETDSHFINFLGIVNDNLKPVFNNQKEFETALTDAIHKASLKKIQELYIVVHPNFIIDLNQYFLIADSYCMRLKFVPDFTMISNIKLSTGSFNDFYVIKPRHEPLQNTYNRLIKRLFDIVFSSLVIVLILSWLYPILAIIIKWQSNGAIIFKQLRTGIKNEPFWCYKFRSMQINPISEIQQARKDDNRVTPIGKFMRKTSLDEMPQFFNVLTGKMSVVGPRPHMIRHTEDYNEQIDNFMVRHYVKPGITGLAQVSGFRGEIKKVSDMKRRVNADIDYLQSWSLSKDIKICFLTVINTLKGDEKAF